MTAFMVAQGMQPDGWDATGCQWAAPHAAVGERWRTNAAAPWYNRLISQRTTSGDIDERDRGVLQRGDAE